MSDKDDYRRLSPRVFELLHKDKRPGDNPCERCGKPSHPDYDLYDYCAVCIMTLCNSCMEKGCCDHTPAKSGKEEDNK